MMTDNPLTEDFYAYYNLGKEQNRLLSGAGQLEYVRTCQVLDRYLHEPVRILDVGGGAGIYALWLASHGHEVHLIDAVPLHVEQARQASVQQAEAPLASATVGDARQLNFDDESFDVVLLFGPMYHLTQKEERLQAMREAYRVVRSGGHVFAVYISRFASMLSGFLRGLDDPEFIEIIKGDLQDGQHRNPKRTLRYFTTAYFHAPDELREEMQSTGLHIKAEIALEGAVWLTSAFEPMWDDAHQRQVMLDLLEQTEQQATIRDTSPHVMVIGEKG